MSGHAHTHEHGREPVHGLPAQLPAGERILWQGAPDWRGIARDVAHVRKVALWFGLLAAWRVASGLHDGLAPSQAALSAGIVLLPAAVTIALLAGLAWLVARTTVYTLTDRRIVMRVGIVLSISFNLPFAAILSAASRPRAQGRGDIALRLEPGAKIAWPHLWPHARAWRFTQPEPMLRSLPDADRVARLLAATLADAARAPGAAAAPTPAPPAVDDIAPSGATGRRLAAVSA